MDQYLKFFEGTQSLPLQHLLRSIQREVQGMVLDVQDASGQLFSVEISVKQIKNLEGEHSYLFLFNEVKNTGTSSEILQEKENEIKSLNKEFERVQLQLNEALKNLKDNNNHSNLQLREDFITNLSHEIRTPLNIIIGYGNLMNDTNLTIEQSEYLNAILTSAYNILSLANNILDAARLDSGMLTLVNEEFNFRNVLSSVELMYMPKAKQKRLELATQVDPRVPELLIGDSMRLTQILSNLIDNSVKFTTKGFVKVSVDLQKDEPTACILRIRLEDSGIGIPPEKIKDIFKRFNQVGRSLDPRFGGSGLGLTIVQSLVELMNGKIEVSSQFGKGTTFTLEIPFEKDFQGRSSEDSLKKVVQSHVLKDRVPKVLLVEDNDVNRRLASLLLSKHNFYVETAVNGQEALEKIRKENFDIILMDIRMPVMDGIEATQKIRQDLKLQIPIIGVTAAVEMEEDKETALQSGMDDFIFKPFNPEDLVAKINAHLELAKTHKASKEKSEISGPAFLEPILNLDYLYSITEGNEEFIEDILGTFLSKASTEINDLVAHCKNRNFDDLKFVAHKLKSSFNIIQFDKIVELLNEIDNTEKSEISWSRFDKIISFIQSIFEKGLEELKNHYPEYYRKYYIAPPNTKTLNPRPQETTTTRRPPIIQEKTVENNQALDEELTVREPRRKTLLSSGENGKSQETKLGVKKTAPPDSHEKPIRKGPKKVLVADDESLVLKTLKFRLEKEGLEVITAVDGREALEKFHQERPDLVITDLMMPFYNGIEVVQAITESDYPCPVIVLSAVGQERTVIDAFKAGASDFISKPFSPDEINIRLKKFVA